jgi:hypothetical protein
LNPTAAAARTSLGKAFSYLQRHWNELTLFLRVKGAPLDSNAVERALKKAILHRKASLFFHNANGARVGDLYMSLIHTAELNGQNPFQYLMALLRNSEAVGQNPQQWLPWNYTETLQRLNAA